MELENKRWIWETFWKRADKRSWLAEFRGRKEEEDGDKDYSKTPTLGFNDVSEQKGRISDVSWERQIWTHKVLYDYKATRLTYQDQDTNTWILSQKR